LGSAQSADIQVWQEVIKQTQPLNQPGGFQASYPDTHWQEVLCAQPQDTTPYGRPPAWPDSTQIPLPVPIEGNGYTARAVGGPIRAAQGSFLNVTGVSSITDSLYGQNSYSLQFNTNGFALPNHSLCGGSPNCQGWVQFIYENNAKAGKGRAIIEYWVTGGKDDIPSCPPPWGRQSDDDKKSCVAMYSTIIPLQPISSFNDQIKLSGQTANGLDTITLIIGGQAYTGTTASLIKEFPPLWQQAQFNVFGSNNYAIANFNSGAILTINTNIDNGTTNAPTCSTGTSLMSTGEWNNLFYNSPCCRYGGSKPSIAFAEGREDNSSKFTCADLGNNTITPVVTPAGSGTITPSVALQVPNRAVSSFTVTPGANYKIGSVSGCGGSLNGNVFTTAPASSNCAVTATLVSTLTYTITASAGAGGSISPPGTITGVAAGSTRSFTVTPSAGYYINQIYGCNGATFTGGSANTTARGYTTGAITGNCTVNASFTKIPPTYTITASADGGGSISPPGAITGVAAGSTRTFTATPNANFRLATISGTCGGTRNGNNYTTNAINANCTVAASFTPILPGTEIPGAHIIRAISNSAEMRYAMDGRTDTIWNSGAPPQPTWIDIDLGKAYLIDTVALNPAQYPNGPSTHNIYAKTETGDTWFLIGTIQRNTSDGQWFSQSFASLNTPVRYVAINTANAGGPGSWVAWREIKVSARENQTVAYTITANAGAGGSISPPGAITGVASGSTRSFTVSPSAGYYITSIDGCNGTAFIGYGADTTARNYTTGAITGNCTVNAAFGKLPSYTITAKVGGGGGGTISPPSITDVISGTTRTLTVTPNAGYYIASITGCYGKDVIGDKSYTTARNYTTGAVTSNCTVIATFVSAEQTAATITLTATDRAGNTGTRLFQVHTGGVYTIRFDGSDGPITSVTGTCGGTWSGSVYTTNVITASCTANVRFY